MSCLGRERILEHQSRALGIPMALIRLNYAAEMRYGVLVDIGRKVRAGEPVDLAMGHLNAIWQGDANAMALRRSTTSPARRRPQRHRAGGAVRPGSPGGSVSCSAAP